MECLSGSLGAEKEALIYMVEGSEKVLVPGKMQVQENV